MKNSSKILIALGAGIVIGGLLGVLFAPEKGSVTREKLSEGGKRFADKLKENLKKRKEKMEEEFTKLNGEEEEGLA